MSPPHATSVALTGYQRDLQHRLDVGARRRQPFVERPTALEVESARAMIARFDAIEQLAAGSLGKGRRPQPINRQPVGKRPPTRLEAAVAVWEMQAHRTLANQPDAADLVGSPACNLLLQLCSLIKRRVRCIAG